MQETIFSGELTKQKTVKLQTFRWPKKKYFIGIICYLFILLFLYSALWISIDYKIFYKEIYKLPLGGNNTTLPWLHKTAGRLLPVLIILEYLTALFIAIAKYRLIGLYLAFTLMVIVNCYLIAVLQFSLKVPFFFGGILPKISLEGHIAFSLVILFISMAGLILYSNKIGKN